MLNVLLDLSISIYNVVMREDGLMIILKHTDEEANTFVNNFSMSEGWGPSLIDAIKLGWDWLLAATLLETKTYNTSTQLGKMTT